MKLRRLIVSAVRGTAIAAGATYGFYKALRDRDAVMQAFESALRPSDAAITLSSVTTLSPEEAQEQIDAGLTIDQMKRLVGARFGAWGQA